MSSKNLALRSRENPAVIITTVLLLLWVLRFVYRYYHAMCANIPKQARGCSDPGQTNYPQLITCLYNFGDKGAPQWPARGCWELISSRSAWMSPLSHTGAGVQPLFRTTLEAKGSQAPPGWYVPSLRILITLSHLRHSLHQGEGEVASSTMCAVSEMASLICLPWLR